jgi:hypothetical protein
MLTVTAIQQESKKQASKSKYPDFEVAPCNDSLASKPCSSTFVVLQAAAGRALTSLLASQLLLPCKNQTLVMASSLPIHYQACIW